MQSPLIEIPDLLQLKLSSNIKKGKLNKKYPTSDFFLHVSRAITVFCFFLEENDDSSRNVPFVVIGCLLALVLLIVMYIALRKKG